MLVQGVDDEFGADVVGDGPAHDLAAEHVEHRGAVDLAFTGRVLGVGALQPVRPVGDEPALDQVVVDGRVRVAAAGLAGSTDAADPGLPHEPSDALAGDRQAHPEPQLGMNARSAVGPAAHLVNIRDEHGELTVRDLPPRRWP